MKGRLLVVDDEKNIAFVMQAMLERAGFEVLVFNDSTLALDAIEHEELDAVITDLYMPGPDGMELLDFCVKHQPQLPVVMITAFGTVESAVAALKRGAFDFITKPFDQAELLNVVHKAVATHQSRQKEPVSLLKAPVAPSAVPVDRAAGDTLVGSSPAIQEIRRFIAKVAPTDSAVFVIGEDGGGKELVAHEIHRHSRRADRPMIKISCASVPPALIESELFGYERGAFAGAATSKPGRLELAHEGTLLIDEVGDLSLETQGKLEQALAAREIERVGGISTIPVDVRVIAASERDLETEVRAGRFREDLYYRLSVAPVRVPPLRERPEDIEPLIQSCLAQFNARFGRSVSRIEPACLRALVEAKWPGNIRQLENVMERMVLMSEGDLLTSRDLPEDLAPSPVASGPGDADGSTFKEIVRRRTQTVERELIERALAENNGNVTRTAEALGLSRKGLQLKMKELGMKRTFDEG